MVKAKEKMVSGARIANRILIHGLSVMIIPIMHMVVKEKVKVQERKEQVTKVVKVVVKVKERKERVRKAVNKE